MDEQLRCGEASVASAIETQTLNIQTGIELIVAGKQASRLRLKHPYASHLRRLQGVAGKQASRLRLKHRLLSWRSELCQRCGEASVASAIETVRAWREEHE